MCLFAGLVFIAFSLPRTVYLPNLFPRQGEISSCDSITHPSLGRLNVGAFTAIERPSLRECWGAPTDRVKDNADP